MPTEIIRAAGARPVKLCSNAFVGSYIGDNIMPRDVCPIVKSVAGNQLSGINEVYNCCDMFVVPITCDCKKMLGKLMACSFCVQ